MEKTIEEKAKAYDNVRDKIAIRFGSNVVKEIFSEYEESEDEKIRKALVKYFQEGSSSSLSVDLSSAITWLEKQGEQKPAVIIPKFRIGDEIKTSNEESLTITKIDEKGYWSEDLFICNFDEECIWDLVEQKPHLSHNDEIMIRQLTEYFTAGHGLQNTNETVVEWLRDVKEKLSRVEQKPVNIRFPHYDNIVDKVFGAGNLESWERDEAEALVALAKEELFKDMQKQWKPSDEQMLAINTAINVIGKDTINGRHLMELVEQLKAL